MSLRKALIILAIVVIPVTVWAATTRAAATCSYTDVSSAVAAASDGDTVTIPAGSVTWSSTLTITKAITLQGAGTSSTIITAATSSTSLIVLAPGSDKSQRVTGIAFVGGHQITISGSQAGSFRMSQFRIDHCSFSTTRSDSISAIGWLEGVIDSNYFYNAQRCVIIQGDQDSSWARPITAGTSHALFIEDNTFVTDNANGSPMDHQVYHQQGGRTVIRHNTFDGSAFSSGDYYAIDSHGNYPYVTGTGYSRGQPLVEVYNNTINFHHAYCPTQFRGGSVLFHDNAFTYTSAIGSWTQLWEEEGWLWPPYRTQWPAQDQINNSFFWNNTVNGVTTTDVGFNNPATDSIFIQKDRDYFMHAPAASGGYTYYTGSRNGGAQTAPTNGTTYPMDSGNTAFSATGANAFYPYTPYTYPHPLRAAGGSTPNPPTGLRLQ